MVKLNVIAYNILAPLMDSEKRVVHVGLTAGMGRMCQRIR